MNVTKKILEHQEQSYWKLQGIGVSYLIDYYNMKKLMYHHQVKQVKIRNLLTVKWSYLGQISKGVCSF